MYNGPCDPLTVDERRRLQFLEDGLRRFDCAPLWVSEELGFAVFGVFTMVAWSPEVVALICGVPAFWLSVYIAGIYIATVFTALGVRRVAEARLKARREVARKCYLDYHATLMRRYGYSK